MDRLQTLLSGLGLGATLMFILDPARGRRRRALVRDKVVRAAHKTGDAINATSRDLTNRTRGVLAEIRSRVTASNGASDDVLVARVRSKMGRYVSHPSAIEVAAHEGRVVLRGPVLEDEVDALLDAVSSVRGVREVENQLEVHEHREDMPSLQGGSRRRGERFELAQEYWSPTARLLAGAAGGSLVTFGARRRDALGIGLGTLGALLSARALSNMKFQRLLGVGAGRRAVDIQKTIHINKPIDEVFAFWDDYANFPHFMRNVREVQAKGNGRSHWVVAGPAGTTVEWEAEVTERIPNEILAWKTVSGSEVANAGILRFIPEGENRTRVDIRLSYNPPGGAVGHAVATLFGADPKHELDEDLIRMKTMLETGNPPHDASKPLKEERATE